MMRGPISHTRTIRWFTNILLKKFVNPFHIIRVSGHLDFCISRMELEVILTPRTGSEPFARLHI
jgi:hypothetical protein